MLIVSPQYLSKILDTLTVAVAVAVAVGVAVEAARRP